MLVKLSYNKYILESLIKNMLYYAVMAALVKITARKMPSLLKLIVVFILRQREKYMNLQRVDLNLYWCI